MYFIDVNGNIKKFPKECIQNTKLMCEYIKREKFGK